MYQSPLILSASPPVVFPSHNLVLCLSFIAFQEPLGCGVSVRLFLFDFLVLFDGTLDRRYHVFRMSSSQSSSEPLPPNIDRGPRAVAIFWVQVAIAITVLIARFWSRKIIRNIGADDWWMLVTLVWTLLQKKYTNEKNPRLCETYIVNVGFKVD